jgi:hypothetical protein
MRDNERLYDTLGELLYVVAMADGIIQQEEIDTLNKILEGHAWAKEIKWSFNYESVKKSDIDDIYNKVIHFCHGYGPSIVYPEFIESMKTLAMSSNGIDSDEDRVISSFSKDLIARLQADLDKI